MTELTRPAAWGRALAAVGSTGLWAVAGRLVQVFGFGHAIKCMGHAGSGLSGQAMVAAMLAQLVLSLGIDVVAVRHVAGGSRSLASLLPAIFTLRLFLHGALALVGLALVPLLASGPEAAFVWSCGCLYFVALGLNYQWYYQATGRMAALSRIQTLSTLAVAVVFLAFFRPGQAAGSDLMVMALVHGGVTAWVWWRARPGLLPLGRAVDQTLRLIREGIAMWLFGLAYNALSLIAFFLMPALLGQQEGVEQNGYFRRSFQPCLALQFVLTYIGYIFYPRIVAWERSGGFEGRVAALALAGLALAGLCYLSLLWLAGPVFGLVYGNTDGVAIFPVLAASRFVGMASGFLVWGLLARRQDLRAVACCFLALGASLLCHLWALPRSESGHVAAGWIAALGESVLFLSCAVAFLRGRARRAE